MDIRPRGRRITHNRDQTHLVARFIVKDIRRCDGSELDGVDLRAVTALRMTTVNSTCGGFCTALDFSFPYKIPMQRGRGKLREMSTNPDVIIPLGLPPIPTTRDWHAQILSLNLVDLAGNDFLVPGLMASKPRDAQVELPKKGASYYQVKPIMAFPKCQPGNAIYTSADGFQSCQGVPSSNCATDPNTALHFGLPAKPEKGGSLWGLWQMRLPPGSEGRGRGSLRYLRTCSDEPYNGPLKEEFDLRVTYFGPACGGQPCTVVDVHPVMDLVATKGFAKFSVELGALLQAANLPPLSASAPVSVEVLGIRALDSAGNVFGVLPGMHVSCREVTGFCFGV